MPRMLRVAPELPVRDLREAVEYYELSLGFTLASQAPDYAVMERDDIALHLFQDSSPPVGLHIFTRDLDGLYAELTSSAARIAQPIEDKPWGNRDFRVLDPSGNVIKFTEPLAEA